MMLRAVMDTNKANQVTDTGKAQQLWGRILERLQPEAVYFSPHAGGRACVIVFDMQDSAQLPVILEPFFNELGAHVELQPCMTKEDLMKGLTEAAGAR
ncbi:hypothetical protein OGH68_19030 [Streptomyces peucetius]|uniref:DUF3303 domain-containing protein n=2 Tax=Streptomyces peucetius TaxID=1950 RepID=A0ABY6IHR6_STRPE|nr:hypothetical protein OGH68_19030 [Streptomyces peucetius]